MQIEMAATVDNVKKDEKKKSEIKTGVKPAHLQVELHTQEYSAFSAEVYLKWFRQMLIMRKMEEKAGQLYLQQKFGGFCHLYIGQEAVVAGTCSALKPHDKQITAYRDHAHPIGLDIHPRYVFAELYGRRTGLSKGKGGSMHMFSREKNFMGGHGIVGAQIPMGAGIAFADKYLGNDAVTVCSMGDGAVRQGSLHETFNMAMMWKLPVLFVIENNHYAMGTSVERTTNVTDLSQLGASYHMPSFNVDGMRCEEVHLAVQKAAQHARSGNGPVLLNIITYRYKGHSMSDPQKYRTRQEMDAYRELDPIEQILQTIRSRKLALESTLEEIRKEVDVMIDEAVRFAEESPLPEGNELYEDVYKTDGYPFIKEFLE